MDKKKYYIIPAGQAKEWYKGYLHWLALNGSGVDNWEWYSESLYNFREGSWKFNHPGEEMNPSYRFENIMEEDLARYGTMEMPK